MEKQKLLQYTWTHESNAQPSRYIIDFELSSHFYSVLDGESDGKFIL